MCIGGLFKKLYRRKLQCWYSSTAQPMIFVLRSIFCCFWQNFCFFSKRQLWTNWIFLNWPKTKIGRRLFTEEQKRGREIWKKKQLLSKDLTPESIIQIFIFLFIKSPERNLPKINRFQYPLQCFYQVFRKNQYYFKSTSKI